MSLGGHSSIEPCMLLFFVTALFAAQGAPDADDDRKSVKAKTHHARRRDPDDDDNQKAPKSNVPSAGDAQAPSANSTQSDKPDDDDRASIRPAMPGDDEQAKAKAKTSSAKNSDGKDDDEERAEPASKIVITARRLDAARTQIDEGLGATVYSLSNDAVENRPGGETGSIANILGQTPGVGLSSFGLTVRGSRSIQVRINDVILPEAILDPAEHLTSRLAEATKLITGTLPAQFGFAPAGVISVTTKNGHYEHGGQAEFFADTRGMIEPAVEWSGATGSTSLFGSGSFERSRDQVTDSLGLSARAVRHELEGLAFGDQLIDDNDRVSLILGGSREAHRFGQTSIGAGTRRNSDGYGVVTFQHSADRLTIQASLFGAAAGQKAEFNALSDSRRTSYGTQVDAAYELGKAHRLRGGLLLTHSTNRESDNRGTIRSDRRTSLGLYAQDEWKITPALTFNPGVRAEWLRGLGSAAEIEPRASLVWAGPKGLTAHLGYARYAIVAPVGEDPALRRLKPERDDYLDLGVQQRLGGLTLGADAYWRKTKNLIVEREVLGSAVSDAFIYRRGRFRGLEFSSTYSRGPVTAWANLTIARGQGRSILDGTAMFSPAVLAAADSHWIDLGADRRLTVSGGLTWRLGKLNLSGDVTAGSGAARTLRSDDPNGARSAAFATFGIAAVYHVRIAGQPADFRADLTNITNVRYRIGDASNIEGGWTRFAQGRALMLGIEQGF